MLIQRIGIGLRRCVWASLRETIPAAIWLLLAAPLAAAELRVLVDGYALELVAREPEVVTPIGLSFDSRGRLLIVESHTHQRPAEYDGPAGDRIRVVADSNGDGKLDRWHTLADGFQQAMNVYARPDGRTYVVTRREVRLYEDSDGDGRADKHATVLRLETTDDYPHNGMSGIVLDAEGDGGEKLFVGVGENSGVDYKIVGSDGRSLASTGGVGTIYRCDPDGGNLERWATGFWNPFALCLLDGQLFCVDNDPDSSPPCRLIEVAERGDYGFRYEYGRAGVHPLIAWNGELPGTLPMMCGVGEAPTAIVAHRGWLWVTSWGDHRIERYQLARAGGGGVQARRTVVVQGDANFRPTGMAVAPDGSLYFADWVDRSYPVHRQGRLWRLTVPQHGNAPRALVRTPPAAERVPRRVAELQKLRWEKADQQHVAETLRRALASADADVRLYAVRWVADERIMELRDDVAGLLDGEIPGERYFLAVLAAIDWLDGDRKMRDGGISDALLIRELKNPYRSPALHALALRLVSPDHKWLTPERLREYMASNDAALKLEAVRTLAARSDPERASLLAGAARDERHSAELRAEAIVGLAPFAESQSDLLEQLAADADAEISREAERVLRLAGKRPPVEEVKPPPEELARWHALLAEGGDAAAGRRLFFMAAGPRCAACHQHRGRGGRVGPDLSRISRQQAPERIIASLLAPSREIAPEFQSWTLATTGGLTYSGLRLPKAGDDGVEIYADAAGREFLLKSEDIESRAPSDASIMPAGVERLLSVDDLRDLVAFLSEP